MLTNRFSGKRYLLEHTAINEVSIWISKCPGKLSLAATCLMLLWIPVEVNVYVPRQESQGTTRLFQASSCTHVEIQTKLETQQQFLKNDLSLTLFLQSIPGNANFQHPWSSKCTADVNTNILCHITLHLSCSQTITEWQHCFKAHYLKLCTCTTSSVTDHGKSIS